MTIALCVCCLWDLKNNWSHLKNKIIMFKGNDTLKKCLSVN